MNTFRVPRWTRDFARVTGPASDFYHGTTEKSNSSGDRYRACIVVHTHTNMEWDGINAIPSLATSAKARVSLIIGRRAAPLSGKPSLVAGFARLNSPHISPIISMDGVHGSMAFHGRRGRNSGARKCTLG